VPLGVCGAKQEALQLQAVGGGTEGNEHKLKLNSVCLSAFVARHGVSLWHTALGICGINPLVFVPIVPSRILGFDSYSYAHKLNVLYGR